MFGLHTICANSSHIDKFRYMYKLKKVNKFGIYCGAIYALIA